LRLAYYVGFPYVALILGVIPSNYLGLKGLGRLPQPVQAGGRVSALERLRATFSFVLREWVTDLGPALTLLAIVGAILAVSWLVYGRVKRQAYRQARIGPVSNLAWHPALSQIIYQQIHWCFYRSAIWTLSGDLYLAAVGGTVLVWAEWFLSPDFIRRVLRVPDAEEPLVDGSLLVATSAVFSIVPNLWLLIPMHWFFSVLSRFMIRWGSGRPQRQFVQS